MRALYLLFAVTITIFSFSSIGWSACEGDLNCDGITDGTDLAIFANDFGTTGCGTCDDVISEINALKDRITVLENLLAGVIRNGNTIQLSGVNLQIVNGTGSTGGTPNGLGNLIVGYDEVRAGDSDKSGSHNLVVGPYHNYSSYGGLVAGYQNTISGIYACVSGGWKNNATEEYASVSGGGANTASNHTASVCGGQNNEASGWASSVSGGALNTAIGAYASVSGGRNNEAIGSASSVTGGGGPYDYDGNVAFADYSSILGGIENETGDPVSTDNSIGQHSTISAGWKNSTQGDYASITGGAFGRANGIGSSIAGGGWNLAYGDYSSVAGGGGGQSIDRNTAHGAYSSVSGGVRNTANYTGQSKTGARPDFDSGWVTFKGNSTKILSHNLGGEPENYIVEFEKSSNSEISIFGIGKDYFHNPEGYLVASDIFWGGLTSTQIVVQNDFGFDVTARVRIWEYNNG